MSSQWLHTLGGFAALGMGLAYLFAADTARQVSTYVLGPDDQITILAVEPEEIANKPIRIASDGTVSLPMVGRFKASGLTVGEFETELCSRLKPYINRPAVSVTVTEFRSQPVSVLGAVNTPGVQHLQGRKTLVEVLSLSGGVRTDSGNTLTVVRSMQWGKIPLADAVVSEDGAASTVNINVKEMLEGRQPERNLIMMPDDVVSVPKAEVVYVLGEVQKPGAYVLNEKEELSALQVIALAGGFAPASSAGDSKVIRNIDGKRTEVPVNLKRLISGKSADLVLKPKDILFVPKSVGKRAALRTMEAAVQTLTGIVIYRH
jgi:polysaccharide export outer membrane protein